MTPRLRPIDMLTTRQDAVETARALRAALARHDIVLPSLDVDLVSYAHFAGRPLIELGRVNDATANALVRVLNGASAEKR